MDRSDRVEVAVLTKRPAVASLMAATAETAMELATAVELATAAATAEVVPRPPTRR